MCHEPDESAMDKTAKPVRIALLVFPETAASVIYGMYDLFMSAGRDWGAIIDGLPGPQLFEPLLVSDSMDPVVVSNDVRILPHATLTDCPPVDIVCVPEVTILPEDPVAERFAPQIGWLRGRFADGALVASACSGALLIADAGLLAGLEATTHWAYCDVLRRRHPNVTVREQRALVVAGEGQRLVMAGGGTSWLDLALYLIARFVGVDKAMQVARLNLIDWHEIGQQPFARLARTRQVDDAVIARCQTWIAENYERAAPVAAMVRLSGLAERSFKRRFQQATGMSPLEYVHAMRIEEAKQMLEAGDESIETVAMEVGYEDAAFFSRLFRRKVNLTPAQYRKRFGALRRSLQTAGEAATKP